MDFKKAHDPVRREILGNILFEFSVSVKLIRPIKMCLSETYSNARIDKHPSDEFPIWKRLKREDSLSPLLFSVALEYAIKKTKENQEGLEPNETY
jgi:hypothetical protein